LTVSQHITGMTRRILIGLVGPDHPPVVVHVEGEDLVRERRVDVEAPVADIERPALVAAQHAGRELPRDPQIADVVAVDLVKLAVAMTMVVAERCRP
jgi:hypothetical protein